MVVTGAVCVLLTGLIACSAGSPTRASSGFPLPVMIGSPAGAAGASTAGAAWADAAACLVDVSSTTVRVISPRPRASAIPSRARVDRKCRLRVVILDISFRGLRPEGSNNDGSPRPSAAGQTKTPVSGAREAPKAGVAYSHWGQACVTAAAFQGIRLVGW